MARSARFKAPLSGPIIGVIVKALRIQSDSLTRRTTRRFFKGRRIKDAEREGIFLEIGKVLVEHGLVPNSPFLTHENVPPEKVIAVAVAWYSSEWDRLVGHMRTASAPVDRADLAAASYLRLVTIDLALRVSAVMWLAELPTPDEETPLWTNDNGGAEYLRRILRKCGKTGLTRDELAERLDVSYNTVDNWLDTHTRPSQFHIGKLAEELAEHIDGLDEESIRRQLHIHYALSDLCQLLTKNVGRETVVDLASALVRFTSRNLAGLREFSKLSPSDGSKAQLLILMTGARNVSSEYLLRALWRQERDPVWKAELMAASKPWDLRLTHIAQHWGGLDQVTQALQEKLGIPQEKANSLLEEVLKEVPAGLTSPHAIDPTELEGKTLIRLSGDEEFSARNRMTQYNQARFEGDLDTALIHIRRAVELQPESAEYHFHLGALLGMVGEVDEGIEECWIAARLDDDWELPRVEVGIILLNAGRNQEALEHLEDLAASRQEDSSSHLTFNLGTARYRAGDHSAALSALEKVIDEEPGHALALDMAAHSAFLIGDQQKGRRLAKLADQHGQSATYREWQEGKYRAQVG